MTTPQYKHNMPDLKLVTTNHRHSDLAGKWGQIISSHSVVAELNSSNYRIEKDSTIVGKPIKLQEWYVIMHPGGPLHLQILNQNLTN